MLSVLRAALTLMITTTVGAEDDTSIPTEVKLPILRDFYRHVYDPDWRYVCTYGILSPKNKRLLCYFTVLFLLV